MPIHRITHSCANIGAHGHFLLEPNNHPKAKIAREIFDREFGGGNRDNREQETQHGLIILKPKELHS
jgi:hypothetical protein